MAKGEKERRMLFDVRGRRRTVIKVVYSVLALLMGLSLILLAGPGIGGLGGGGGGNPAEASEERIERLEARLKEEPGNADLLLNLTRSQIAVANALSETDAAENVVLTASSRQQLERASSTWSEYLEAAEEPSASGAQLISGSLFSLAETSRSAAEAQRNSAAAAEAQRIVTEARPSVGSFSSLAFYSAYAGNFKAAEEALAEAEKRATSKFERQQIQNQFKQVEEGARQLAKQVREAEKAAQEGAQNPGGSENFQNPFGLGGGSAE